MSQDAPEVRLEIRINASPKVIFTLLTDPVHMRTWLAEFVESDARPGGVFRISGPIGVSIEGTYLEVPGGHDDIANAVAVRSRNIAYAKIKQKEREHAA
jgi:uncharacterized protein YndB with AHSA1/START domain